MNDRLSRNFISFVNTSGGRKEKAVGIKREVRDFFMDNFQEKNVSKPVLKRVDFSKLTVEDSNSLEVVFIENEIKAAIWSCSGNKIHGPDGFTFLQECWDTIKEDVVRFVSEFYSNPTLSKEAITSFISLVPKITNPQFLVNYKLICLVSCFQKTLSKILASRLKKTIWSIISVEQSSFVLGRSISDRVVVVNELLGLTKQLIRECTVLKINYKRAYGCVS
ncbi:uncharacterized protein LOC127103024 [Lathyrus oleraceus]|uniref:uncharacterized protein LOC127103024 n=1 Tax=Pisum sativum TaxID=3888 RepID=UPI0021D1A411|nr:uncharacterized protein LOC127103024 [Pisum sativum]